MVVRFFRIDLSNAEIFSDGVSDLLRLRCSGLSVMDEG